jgi:hypothetical protein
MRPRRRREGLSDTVGRLAVMLDHLSVVDLLPAEFDPDRLAEDLSRYVEDHYDSCRQAAARLRVGSPEASPDEWVDALFEPFLRGAVKVMAGGAAIEVVPLSILIEDATRNQAARSLLGRQIELVATAGLLYDPQLAPRAASADALAVLDAVHGLDQVRDDLRKRDLLTTVKAKGGEAAAYVAARLVLKQVAGVLFAGGRLFEAWRRYSKFRELRAAVEERCGDS